MKAECQHKNPILITDENWNESLPVKQVLICPDCNTEIVNESLMLQTTETYEKWKREKDNQNMQELLAIKQPPLYIKKK